MVSIRLKDDISQDKTINLQGCLKKFLFKNRVRYRELEVFYQGNKIGECKSNKKGKFNFEYTFEKNGLHEVQFQIKEKPSIQASLSILIPDESIKKAVLICDIDNTVVDFGLLRFIMGSLQEIEGAAKILKLLSEQYFIVYLTHRHKKLTKLTKKWLNKHDFPIGPIFFWSIKNEPLRSKSYKCKTLQVIKNKSGKIPLEIGIGDRESDMEAYQSIGIKQTYHIKDSNDWQKIQEEALCLSQTSKTSV